MGPAVCGRRRLLGMRVDAGADTRHLVETMMQWARARRSGYVCPLTVASLLEGSRSVSFRRIVNSADAAPCVDRQLAWWLEGSQARRYPAAPGQALLLRLCARALALDVPIGLYAVPGEARDHVESFLRERLPGLRFVAAVPEPMAAPTLAQDAALTRLLNASGARLLLVNLGSPAEEEWMLNHKGRVHAVMVGTASLWPDGFTAFGTAAAGRSGHPGFLARITACLPRQASLRLGWRILQAAWGRAQEQAAGRPHLGGPARLRR